MLFFFGFALLLLLRLPFTVLLLIYSQATTKQTAPLYIQVFAACLFHSVTVLSLKCMLHTFSRFDCIRAPIQTAFESFRQLLFNIFFRVFSSLLLLLLLVLMLFSVVSFLLCVEYVAHTFACATTAIAYKRNHITIKPDDSHSILAVVSIP